MENKRFWVQGVAFCACLVCGLVADAGENGGKSGKSGKNAKIAEAERVLGAGAAKLADYTFGKAELSACEKVFRELPEKSPLRARALAVLATYHREYGDNPDKALAFLAPYFLGEKEAGEWKRAVKAADGDGRRLTPGFPPAASWRLETPGGTAPDLAVAAAVEAVFVLAEAGDTAGATAAVGRIGTEISGEPRVRMAECGGDLFMRTKDFARALEFYRFGVSYLNDALGRAVADDAADGRYRKEFDAHEKRLRARLERKLREAERAQAADRYGPDFVLYRDAETARRVNGNPAEAYLLYRDLIAQYPETVYAEAARAYAVAALWDLGLHPEKAAAKLAETQKGLAGLKKLGEAAARAKAGKPVRERLAARIADAEKSALRVREIPAGEKAEAAAVKAAEEFCAAVPLGLYRGEVLLTVAERYLDDKLDPENGEKWLARAGEWLEKVKEADEKLAALEVPARAAGVAAAPAASFRKDEWGNILPAAVAPGQVVNRRTCGWYLDDLRTRTNFQRGFLEFVAGRMDKAKEYFTAAGQTDSYIRHSQENNLPNPLRRLMVRCDEGTFLRSTKEEMRGFKQKQRRFAIMMADFHTECEKYAQGEKIYRRLLGGEWGKLNIEEEAYARLSFAFCSRGAQIDTNDKGKAQYFCNQAIKTLEPFMASPDLLKTPVAPRALIALGSYYSSLQDGRRMKLIEPYKLLVKHFPQTDYAPRALMLIATQIRATNEEKYEAEKQNALKQLAEKYPKSQYANLALQMMEILDKQDNK